MTFTKNLAAFMTLSLLLVSAWATAGAAQSAPSDEALIVGVQLEPPNLDPTSGAAAAIDEIVYANVFEGLTRIKENGEPAPALATDWSVSDGGRTYTFQLRENVRFHDGTAFDADDVVFTFERAKADDSANAQKPIWSLIETVRALDTYTVEFTLSEPLGAFPTYLGWGDAVIVAPETADANTARPIGTGPFQFHRWRRGADVTLLRQDDYWGAAPALGAIVFTFIPDPTAAFAALLAGDVDGFPNYPAPENLSLIAEDDRFAVLSGTGEGEMILAINNAAPPFDDLRVRRALSHAINKSDIIDGALFGFGQPIGSHFPPHHPSYEDLTGLISFDSERARQLLAEAGYPKGFSTTLHLPPPAYARRSGEIIAAALRDIGISVEIENIEWAQWLDQVFTNKDYALTIVAHTEPLDIDIYARTDYYFNYQNTEFNEVIARLRSAVDEDARDRLYKDAQTIIAEDAVNVFLAQGSKTGVWRKDVAGVWSDAPLQANDFTQASNPARQNRISGDATSSARGAGWAIFGVLLTLAGIAALVRTAGASPAYLGQRFVAMLMTLFFGAVLIFAATEAAPGDPARFMMGMQADDASVAALREELGLNEPVFVRFFGWLGDMARGDFGLSYTYRAPVAELIAERLAVSLPLAIFAFTLSAIIAIPAGVFAAQYRHHWRGRTIISLSQAGVAIPNFWLAILLVLSFSVGLGWFSAGGFAGWDAGLLAGLKSLALPAVALALPQAAILTQIVRSAMITAGQQDYVRTARAKGAGARRVLWRHMFPNALIPILTILGLQFSFLLAGAVIVENVFYLPGLGRLLVQAIAQRDLIVVKGAVFVLIFVVVLIAFIVDLAYGAADPRLRARR